jgi:hypothetical protein
MPAAACRLVLRLHMDALIAKRTFWETLLHNNVTFDKLARATARIDSTVKASERMYKQVGDVPMNCRQG